MRLLRDILENLSDSEHYLFSPNDFSVVFSDISKDALKMLLHRAVSEGLLKNICRGIYLNPKVNWPRGLTLYHAASKLRAYTFNYISLESALSDLGVISQIPINWLSIMTGGRSGTISCGAWGTIEFIHTSRSAECLASDLIYDHTCRLWRASPALAINDMKLCKRPMDLVDWSVVNELI
jgi:hypothetical protein